MLRSADATLACRDPVVPGLGLVLDPGALLDRLLPAFPSNAPRPIAAEVGYLRYKPETSLLAGYRLTTQTGTMLAWVKAWGPRAAPKLAAAGRFGWGDPTGFGVVVDEPLRLALGAETSDRALPGVRAVRRGRGLPVQLTDARLRAVRYKPERRWVAVADVDNVPAALVKVHRPAVADRAVATHRQLAAAGLPLPRLLGHHERRGVVAVDWVPGAPPNARHLPAVGAALARLHAVPAPQGFAAVTQASLVRGAVDAIAALAPEHAAAARHVAALVEQRLVRDPGPRAVVHGDLSMDQVIVGADGVTLLDWDRAGVGDPAADLGSWAAASILASATYDEADPAVLLGPLLDGYEATTTTPIRARLAPWTAAALLQRATEPFRLRAPHWDDDLVALVRAAQRMLGSRR